ncbi:MAG: carbohydrate deacetylase [Campylobacterales bacterium]
MNLKISADDFGNSLNMSRVIYDCYKNGALNSMSVMVNSEYLDDSLALLDSNKHPNTSLHINIAEGKPVSNPKDIPLLVDSSGRFNRGFVDLLLTYYLASSKKKAQIKHQIELEVLEQITLYTKKLQTSKISLDSHQHYHALPFVADAILEGSRRLEDVSIEYIRVPYERFFFHIGSLQDAKNYFGANIIKHIILDTLSVFLKKKLRSFGVSFNDAFIGVLFTGRMTLDSIKKALVKTKPDDYVELLLHPGYISATEEKDRAKDRFTKFYSDVNRKKEADILTSDYFAQHLKGRL